MPLYGVDISHHQGSFPVDRLRREGFSFAIFKATEGSGFVDNRFASNLANARKAGILHAAYHYQRAGISAAAQVAHIKRVVPKDCPIIPDVEQNSGNVGLTREIVNRLRDAGYRVPLSYIPRWYWDGHLGRPSLAGLPPLWSSRYVTGGGYASQIYQRVPTHYWDGYGDNSVAVLQYSSSATVAGRTPIDVNAFRGTRDELAALFTGEDDMPSAEEITKAVWEHQLKNNITGETDDAGTLLRYGHSHSYKVAQALPALLDDESKLSTVINQAVDRVGTGDKETIKAAFIEALREVLRVEATEEEEPQS